MEEIDDLVLLKLNLLEVQFPFYTDEQLQTYLDLYGDVRVATYYACMTKAQDDSVNFGPIKTVSTEKFWLRRAKMFRPLNSGIILRVDEIND